MKAGGSALLVNPSPWETEANMYDLNTLYKQELNYYKNLLKLTHQLERAAEHGKIEDLDPVFAKREKILAKISAREEDRRTLSEKANSN